MTRYLLQVFLVLLVFCFALVKGGKPEKYVSTTYLFMLLAGVAFRFVTGGWSENLYGSLHAFRFAVDVGGLCAIWWVALRFDRWWTLWVGSLQLIAVLAHLLPALGISLHPQIYAIMERWPAWVALTIIGVGTAFFMRRQSPTAKNT